MFCGVIFARSTRDSGNSRSTRAKSMRKVLMPLSGSLIVSSVEGANAMLGAFGSASGVQAPASKSIPTINVAGSADDTLMVVVPNSKGCQKCDQGPLLLIGKAFPEAMSRILAAAEDVRII